MQNKWMIILGLWVFFIGLCYWFLDKSIGFMSILCWVVGIAGIVGFVVNNIFYFKHRKELK